MPDPVIEWNEPEFRRVFQSWEGPVGRDIARKCRVLEVRAMLQSGLDTGRLIASIDTLFEVRGGVLIAHVGANPGGGIVGYSMYHHEGTGRHAIVARNAEFLRFPNRRGRGMVVTRSVSHPGNRPNHYLTDPMREVFQ